MGLSPNLISLLLFLLMILTQSATDYSSLVYKGCSKQKVSDPKGEYSQSISAVFGTLVSQSTKTKFYKTTVGAVSSLFQCRGDLSNTECYTCVSEIPTLAIKLCSGTSAAARIQLQGCYMLYEVSGFPQISGLELLYKSCGRGKTSGYGGFQDRRDTVVSAVESGVVGNGFFATSDHNFNGLAQCEGDLGTKDCTDCVKTAFQRATTECGDSGFAQIFLLKCFVSYSNGRSPSPDDSGSGQNTMRTVAIILGGALGVGFVVICLLFARNLVKKDDY